MRHCAPYVAHRLGVLQQFRQGEEKVLWDIAAGWEWYWDYFQKLEFGWYDPRRS